MKTYYIRLAGVGNQAREIQELRVVCLGGENAWRRLLAAAEAAAGNWGLGNGSRAVRFNVEDYSGAFVLGGERIIRGTRGFDCAAEEARR